MQGQVCRWTTSYLLCLMSLVIMLYFLLMCLRLIYELDDAERCPCLSQQSFSRPGNFYLALRPKFGPICSMTQLERGSKCVGLKLSYHWFHLYFFAPIVLSTISGVISIGCAVIVRNQSTTKLFRIFFQMHYQSAWESPPILVMNTISVPRSGSHLCHRDTFLRKSQQMEKTDHLTFFSSA